MPLNLDELEPYFDDLSETDEAKLDELYGIFESNFYLSTLEVNNKSVRSKRHWYNPIKDGLPDFYSRYYEKFVHIITRKSDLSGNRQFEIERANRIHWIRPILENNPHPDISFFRFQEGNGDIRDYFWLKPKSFIVIL